MTKINVLFDIVNSIKNNYTKNHKFAYCSNSKFALRLLYALYKEGLISGFKVESMAKIKIKLKYYRNKSLLENIVVLYKPSLKKIASKNEISKQLSNYDILFISTNAGLISSKDFSNLASSNQEVGGIILLGVKLMNKLI